MIGSTYSPVYWDEFRSDKVSAMGYSVSMTATAGADTSVDFKIDNDLFIRSVGMLFSGSVFGDHIKIQIVDVDGVYVPAGTVLKTPISSWYVVDTATSPAKFSPLCPNKALGGVYFRLTYTSTGILPVNVKINLETLVCLE